MLFSLIHPSRGRPQQAFDTVNKWISKASDTSQIEHILSLDSDDATLSKYIGLMPSNVRAIENNTCVVEAANHAAEISKGKILIYLSDDFDCPDKWDLRILESIFVDERDNWLLKVNDGYQPFQAAVLTIPIMSRAAYNELGYFFNPLYKSMWVDVDLFYECRSRGWIIEAPELIFEHLHPAAGKAKTDATYQRSLKNWEQGIKAFHKRKREQKWVEVRTK